MNVKYVIYWTIGTEKIQQQNNGIIFTKMLTYKLYVIDYNANSLNVMFNSDNMRYIVNGADC